MKQAFYIGNLNPALGQGKIYKISTKIPYFTHEGKKRNTSHLLMWARPDPHGMGFTTLAFPSDRTGRFLNWQFLPKSAVPGFNPEQSLTQLGFKLSHKKEVKK